MDSVIRSIGTNEFPRVRLGIDTGRTDRNGANFVLSPFRKAQLKELDEVLDYCSRAVESIVAEGVEKAMTRFNRRSAQQPEPPAPPLAAPKA
jgi:PTH1 family peptidyl-tRNA hydrolase